MKTLLFICQIGMYLVQWIILTMMSVNLLKSKNNNRIVTYIAMLFTGFFIASTGRIALTLTKMIFVNVVICAFAVCFANFVYFRDSVKRRMAVACLEIILTWIGEMLTAQLLLTTANAKGNTMQYGYQDLYNYPQYVVLSNIYSTLVFFVLFMCSYAIWKGVIDHIWIREYLMYTIIPIYQLVLIFIYYVACKNLEDIELKTGVWLVIFSLIIDLEIGYLITGIFKKRKIQQEIAVSEVQYQAEQLYYERANQSLRDIEKNREWYQEQLQEIYHMIKQGESADKIQNVLNQSTEHLQGTQLKRYCENAVVNAILMIKTDEAAEKEIQFCTECSVPEEIGISVIDLCSLFTNMIDNAIEASEKLSSESRRISMKAGIRGNYLIIKTENSYIGRILKEGGHIITSKKDKANHGYGIRLIEQITKEYQGNVDIQTEESMFKMTVILQMRSDHYEGEKTLI